MSAPSSGILSGVSELHFREMWGHRGAVVLVGVVSTLVHTTTRSGADVQRGFPSDLAVLSGSSKHKIMGAEHVVVVCICAIRADGNRLRTNS